ncbi:hypothetical protein P872_09460 [Rhodonellum psychrophilum GCM71 = DSM 17998]|uniref:Uncharacterized protein n=1 Tax=Rhodonellum psychrophilum GCM71 = DSM 17998 TaxID=1123057 RepID=U5BZW2_9BACT|nr:hypothetical protein P872_09460 [Rhodonellum psychrophilum GCM71 = DSM 17998]
MIFADKKPIIHGLGVLGYALLINFLIFTDSI